MRTIRKCKGCGYWVKWREEFRMFFAKDQTWCPHCGAEFEVVHEENTYTRHGRQ